MHKILAHSWELVEINGGTGLKAWSEEGMEANNKRLRLYREKLSRKNNQVSNLTDCFRRLWVGSDPLVANERMKGKTVCSLCGDVNHTKRSCFRHTVDYDLMDIFI